MNTYDLTRLDNTTLLGQLSRLVAGERAATAVILAHIAEVDLRRLYLPAAYSSMYAYCVGALGLSEGAAFRRVQSARAARRFPRLFDEVATGRLHLTAISMLAPHLCEANADEMIAAAAARRSRSELAAWLAQRFPAEGATLPPAQVRPVAVPAPPPPAASALPFALPASASRPSSPIPPETPGASEPLPAERGPDGCVNSPISGEVNWQIGPAEAPPPPAHPYFVLRVALGETTHAKLERAQVLLAHSVRSGQVAEVLDRALDALLAKLEQRRGAGPARTPRPQPAPRTPDPNHTPRADRTDGRAIPAAVRREVWARDGGRCTFTSSAGRQCGADRGLEFDHVRPVARGGESTAANLRLRCRAHNQLEAERQFGADFMRQRREQGRPEARTSTQEAGRAAGGDGPTGAAPPGTTSPRSRGCGSA